MIQMLTIALSEAGQVMLILGIIGLVLAIAAFIIWNDLFRSKSKK